MALACAGGEGAWSGLCGLFRSVKKGRQGPGPEGMPTKPRDARQLGRRRDNHSSGMSEGSPPCPATRRQQWCGHAVWWPSRATLRYRAATLGLKCLRLSSSSLAERGAKQASPTRFRHDKHRVGWERGAQRTPTKVFFLFFLKPCRSEFLHGFIKIGKFTGLEGAPDWTGHYRDLKCRAIGFLPLPTTGKIFFPL